METRSRARAWSDPRKLAELDGLRVRARHLIEGLVEGLHRNPRTGRTVEFSTHRNYVPGDDLRHMDWRAFARTDRLHVKSFQDETNLSAWLVVDHSRSMDYSSNRSTWTKWQYAQLLTAGLTWIVLQQQDAMGLAVLDSEVRVYLPASGQQQRFDQVIDALDQQPPGEATNLAAGLQDLANRIPRRGLVFLISDFLDDLDRLAPALRQLASHEHEIRALHVIDPAESTFPFERPTRFLSLEQPGELTVDGRRLQDAYRAEFRAHVHALQAACRQVSMRYLSCPSDVPLAFALHQMIRDGIPFGAP